MYEIISIIILGVSLISLCLFVIGILSYRKTGDLAFGTFFVKNLITAIGYQFSLIPHGDLELFDASFDLIAMFLLLIPIFKKPNNNQEILKSNIA